MQGNSLCDTVASSVGLNNPSPLALAKQGKESLKSQSDEIDRLINLLENNPEIEELLKLSRRYL